MSLNGTVIANNSYVDIDSIGSHESEALICHTDCCMSTNEITEGNWYYPNGTMVRMAEDNMGVHIYPYMYLFLDNLLNVERFGRFYCVVNDTNDTNHTLYINICELLLCPASIHITSSAIQWTLPR